MMKRWMKRTITVNRRRKVLWPLRVLQTGCPVYAGGIETLHMTSIQAMFIIINSIKIVIIIMIQEATAGGQCPKSSDASCKCPGGHCIGFPMFIWHLVFGICHLPFCIRHLVFTNVANVQDETRLSLPESYFRRSLISGFKVCWARPIYIQACQASAIYGIAILANPQKHFSSSHNKYILIQVLRKRPG